MPRLLFAVRYVLPTAVIAVGLGLFLLDPTVVGADYGLGRILADAYPDQAKLQEIWKLYSGSVTGGSLLNLTPVKSPPPAPTKPAAPGADSIEKP